MKKGDYILIAILIILSLASFFWIKKSAPTTPDKYVSVKVDGEEIKRLEFTRKTEGQTFEIVTDYGRNVIEMEKDRVHVIEASCPDKLDVKQGYISRPGEMIICLPNHLVVEVRSDKGNDIDIVNQ